MPLQISVSKLKSIFKEYGYVGEISELGLVRMEEYVRKFYGLKDNWKFRGLERKNIDGDNVVVYNFDHSSRVVAE